MHGCSDTEKRLYALSGIRCGLSENDASLLRGRLLMRQVTDATDPSYWAGPCGGHPPRAPHRSSGWLWGEFRSVPRRASTVPDSFVAKSSAYSFPSSPLCWRSLVARRVNFKAQVTSRDPSR